MKQVCQKLFLITLPLATLGSLVPLTSVKAQITPDNSLGAERSVVNANVTIPDINIPSDRIDGGARRGSNLFHSFQEFNISARRGAYFSNPPRVDNIFTRVTGSNPSNISGTLGVLGSANLFLINPNGIVFGPHASLDLRGSFFASTASSLIFNNGFEFSAINPQAPPLLTVNIPIGLRFRDNPGSITVNGLGQTQRLDSGYNDESVKNPPTLAVDPGQTLALVGGNVTLNGGVLQALGGQVELGGLTAAGMVGINSNHSLIFPDDVERADVSLKNASNVDVSGGSIAVNARNLDLQHSSLTADISQSSNTPSLSAGGITLNATGIITLGQSSQIETTISGNATGNGSNINITTGSLLITNDSMNVSEVNTFTSGQGNAGNVNIKARDTLEFDGASDSSASGIVSVAQLQSTGNAGNISINTKTLSLTNGAQVSTIAPNNSNRQGSQGSAGSVMIYASDRVSLDGMLNDDMRSAVNNFNSTNSRGNSGGISITTGTFSLTNGAVLNTSTSGMGNAGNVTIDAPNGVSLNNGQILTSTNEGSMGKGGDVSITSGDISLANSSLIILSTNGQGNAGNALLTSRSLSLADGSKLTLSTTGPGKAGNAILTARSLSFTNGSQLIASSSPTNSSVNGGAGLAGNITLQIGDLLLLRNQSLISTSAGSNAFSGNGGSITIDAPLIVASPQNNDITANAFNGTGGGVTIRTQGLFNIAPLSRTELEQLLKTKEPSQLDPNRLPTSDITAISQSSSLNGGVNTNNSYLNPSQNLVELPKNVVDATRQIAQNPCQRGEGSTFAITGRGGIPSNPNQTIASDNVRVGLVTPVLSRGTATTTANLPSTKPNIKKAVPVQGWVFNNKGQVVLTAYDPMKTGSQRPWQTPASCPQR